MAQYKDTIIQKYLDLISDNTTGIKGFFNGIVGKIPEAQLPAVIIDIERTEVDEFSNDEDVHRVELIVIYVADIRRSFEEASSVVAGLNNVKEVLVGRNANYTLKDTSILDILRSNLNIDSANNLRTDVGGFSVVTPTEVATGRFPGLHSAEGNIRFTAHFVQER
ncbi:MAG TPA: hypothetical protein ENI23_11175 [bacterium]|nr:hypothetical protein [bacterium]